MTHLRRSKILIQIQKNLVIKELDAAQTPRALDSITAAVINDDFATTAKLTVEESIYTEPVNKDSEQWINIIVANKKRC